MQHVKEMAGYAVIIGFDMDALAIGMKTAPVKQHRGQTGEQPVGDVMLVFEIAFGLDVAKN